MSTKPSNRAYDLGGQDDPQIVFLSGESMPLRFEEGDRRFFIVGDTSQRQQATVALKAMITPDQVSAEPVMPKEVFYALEGPFTRHPRLGIALLAAAITLLLCIAPEDPYTDDQHEAVADQLAASEVQP